MSEHVESLPASVRAATDTKTAAARLGEALGLDRPAPSDATERALADPRYARALMASRNIPALRDRLFEVAHARTDAPPAQTTLMKKAAKGVLKWGMAGLKPAAPWVIERRLAACAACPFNAPAPDRLVYRGARIAVGKEARVCTSCHCLINTKAALSSEHCPERDPENPETSRWGEPWVPPEDLPDGPW